MQYCLSGSDVEPTPCAGVLTTTQTAYWAVSPAIMTVMIIEKFAFSYNLCTRMTFVHRMLEAASRWESRLLRPNTTRRLGCICKYACSIVAEFWLVDNMCIDIKVFVVWILPMANDSAGSDLWPLGQINAVAIWIPVVLEYFYRLLSLLMLLERQSVGSLFFLTDGADRDSTFRSDRPGRVMTVGSNFAQSLPMTNAPATQPPPAAPTPIQSPSKAQSMAQMPSTAITRTQLPLVESIIEPPSALISGTQPLASPRTTPTTPPTDGVTVPSTQSPETLLLNRAKTWHRSELNEL